MQLLSEVRLSHWSPKPVPVGTLALQSLAVQETSALSTLLPDQPVAHWQVYPTPSSVHWWLTPAATSWPQPWLPLPLASAHVSSTHVGKSLVAAPAAASEAQVMTVALCVAYPAPQLAVQVGSVWVESARPSEHAPWVSVLCPSTPAPKLRAAQECSTHEASALATLAPEYPGAQEQV